jgi:glycyl-tRNA synthetase (class II)
LKRGPNFSYGWIECVGCADRSAYDLTVHKDKTGAPLVVRQTLIGHMLAEAQLGRVNTQLQQEGLNAGQEIAQSLVAEIEHYVDPEGGKKHSRFDEVKDTELSLLDRNVYAGGSAAWQGQHPASTGRTECGPRNSPESRCRPAYDLTVHKDKTGAPLVVRQTRAEPLRIEEYQIDLSQS